jgi:hypothetical protein
VKSGAPEGLAVPAHTSGKIMFKIEQELALEYFI